MLHHTSPANPRTKKIPAKTPFIRYPSSAALSSSFSCDDNSITLAIWKITGDSADALTVGRKLLDDPDWLVQQIGMEHFEELGVDVCR